MNSLQSELIKKTLFLQRYNPDALKEIETKLKLATDDIIELISKTKNITAIKKLINEKITDAFNTFESVLINDDVPAITELAYVVSGKVVADYTTKKFVDPKKSILKELSSDSQILGYTLNDHIKHLNYTTNRNLLGAIRNGFSQGQGIEEISRNIREITGGIHRHQARTIARTNMLNQIQKAQGESMGYFEDEIIAWRYSSTIDGRTSKTCLMMNNKEYKKKSDAPVQPLNHFNCRSIWIPITKKSKEIEEKETLITQWDSKTVNHRDGTHSTKFKVDKTIKVPKGLSGEKMFEYFDEDYKAKYLGTTRYKLYKSGKASLKEMIDISKNEFIPLNELETLI